jgi:hypothetical protein
LTNSRKIVISILAAALFSPAIASAVIQVKMPVSRIYGTSKAVYIGSVSDLTPTSRLVNVKITSTLRGESPGEAIRIQIVTPAGLIAKVAKDAPVVLFVGKARGGTMAILHLADTWLLAKRASSAKPQLWRVVQKHDAKQTFPGRTAALVSIVKKVAAGEKPILDSTDVAFFRSPLRKIAKLDVTNPRWIIASDAGRSRTHHLLVGTDKNIRRFTSGKEGYTDTTEKWGLESGPVAWRASLDLDHDGRMDYIFGDTILLDSRTKTQTIKLPLAKLASGDKPLAATVAYVRGQRSGSRKLAAYFLSASGKLQEFRQSSSGKPWETVAARQLWPADTPVVAAAFGNFGDTGSPSVLAVRQSGVTRYSLDPTGGAPADFERLTGVNLKKYYERYADGFKNPLITTLDVNGDKRLDMLIICDTGGMLMVNRGYGTFLCDYDSGGEIAVHPKAQPKLKITAQTPWTSIDLHRDRQDDLLILTADGTLYELSNKPRPKSGKKP